jgi:hypothetical protein
MTIGKSQGNEIGVLVWLCVMNCRDGERELGDYIRWSSVQIKSLHRNQAIPRNRRAPQSCSLMLQDSQVESAKVSQSVIARASYAILIAVMRIRRSGIVYRCKLVSWPRVAQCVADQNCIGSGIVFRASMMAKGTIVSFWHVFTQEGKYVDRF